MARIVLCDSGLGGLDIAARCFRPADTPLDLVYFNAFPAADTGYNDLPPEAQDELFYLTLKSMEKFAPDACVIACNTLSIIWERLKNRRKPSFPVVGIIDGAVGLMSGFLREIPDSAILIVGTKTTVESGCYQLRLRQAGFAPERIRALALPGLARLLESGPASSEAAVRIDAAARTAAEMFPAPNHLGVALCCTHYGYAETLWQKAFAGAFPASGVTILNPNAAIVPAGGAASFRYCARIPLFPGVVEHLAPFFDDRAPAVAEALRQARPDPDLFPFSVKLKGQQL